MGPNQTRREAEPRVVHEIRIGSVVAVVRAAPTPSGVAQHTVELQCTTQTTGHGHPGTVLLRDDLLLAARALEPPQFSRSEYPQWRKQLKASDGVTASRTDCMAVQRASRVRQPSERSSCLTLAKTISMGLRSGE